MSPVAQQSEAAIQVTAVRVLPEAAGLGLEVVVHPDPFHRSMSVVVGLPVASMVDPTAQQSDGPAQLTPDRYCPPGLVTAGGVTIDHWLPFHCSTKAAEPATLGTIPGKNPYWI